jgi:2,4-dienoyl-CoA reductase-like NADH-dependent reductase (Old Yellow Enzyme family)
MNKYAFLEPIQVGHMSLKNRVILTPMARYIASSDGFITDRYCKHFERIAKGGTALILPGIAVIDSTWPYISTNQPWLDDDKFIPGMAHFVDVIHAADAHVGFQLWCSGLAKTDRSVTDFSLEQIRRLQRLYLEAARRGTAAGADAGEVQMAHTYMPGQFLSPAWNKRHDQYGADTVENAVRFSLECINMLREELCDEHFDILVKINGADYVEGGVTPEWSAKACEYLEEADVAMLTVNAGGALARVVDMSDDGRRPEGWKVYLAENIKKHVHIPVAACGDIRHTICG